MNIKVGDTIKFRSVTRSGARPAERKVNGFWLAGEPTVRFHGWGEFIVHLEEIQEVNGVPVATAHG